MVKVHESESMSQPMLCIIVFPIQVFSLFSRLKDPSAVAANLSEEWHRSQDGLLVLCRYLDMTPSAYSTHGMTCCAGAFFHWYIPAISVSKILPPLHRILANALKRSLSSHLQATVPIYIWDQ